MTVENSNSQSEDVVLRLALAAARAEHAANQRSLLNWHLAAPRPPSPSYL
jgi:hypothetical protein